MQEGTQPTDATHEVMVIFLLVKLALALWNMSVASGELSLLPKPLSVITQNSSVGTMSCMHIREHGMVSQAYLGPGCGALGGWIQDMAI